MNNLKNHTSGIRQKIANREKFVKGREYRLLSAKRKAEKKGQTFGEDVKVVCKCAGLPKYDQEDCFRPGGSACVRRGRRYFGY